MQPTDRFKSLVKRGDASTLRDALAEDASLRAVINEPIFSFDSPALVANSRNAEVVDVLLEFGADPNRKSSWWAGGFHPLYGTTPEIAERLMAAGAVADACAAAALDRLDLLKQILDADPARVHERGGDGQTPLHFARSREAVDILIDTGADLDARDVDHRSTAAEWMVGDRGELARYLVERGASADIFLAAALGLTDRVRSMLEREPTLSALRTSQGEYGEKPPSSYHIYMWTLGQHLTPLQVAAKFGQHDTVAAMKSYSPTERVMERAIPVLPGDSVTAAREFYAKQLGFDVAWEATENGVEGLIGFRRGGIELTVDCPMDGHGRKACVSLDVADADAYHDEWKRRVGIERPPEDQYWGRRTFSVTDPFGNTIFVMGPVK